MDLKRNDKLINRRPVVVHAAEGWRSIEPIAFPFLIKPLEQMKILKYWIH